jgi:hypothetical protein
LGSHAANGGVKDGQPALQKQANLQHGLLFLRRVQGHTLIVMWLSTLVTLGAFQTTYILRSPGFYAATQPQNAAVPWPTISPPRTGSGFLVYLHSSIVTMSQKSTVLQADKSDDVDGLSSTASKCQSVVARSATMRETVRGKIYQNWR